MTRSKGSLARINRISTIIINILRGSIRTGFRTSVHFRLRMLRQEFNLWTSGNRRVDPGYRPVFSYLFWWKAFFRLPKKFAPFGHDFNQIWWILIFIKSPMIFPLIFEQFLRKLKIFHIFLKLPSQMEKSDTDHVRNNLGSVFAPSFGNSDSVYSLPPPPPCKGEPGGLSPLDLRLRFSPPPPPGSPPLDLGARRRRKFFEAFWGSQGGSPPPLDLRLRFSPPGSPPSPLDFGPK